MDDSLWGMAAGDIDGSGEKKLVLLGREFVKIGRLGDKGFDDVARCDFGSTEGARVYAVDLDGDGDDEIVISGVESGMPSSLAFDFKDGKCSALFEHAKLSLRAIEGEPGKKALVGQSSSPQAFFSGPVRKVIFDRGKLKAGDKIKLPGVPRLYQFTFIKGDGGEERVAVVKGHALLEVYEKRGNKFKRIWRTGERFGGSANLLAASERQLLDAEQSEAVYFDTPPVPIKEGDFRFSALRQEMPIRGVIGRRPLIRGGEIVIFRPDEAFAFIEESRTAKLPGAIMDYDIDTLGENGAKRLLVLLQDDISMFHEGGQSMLVRFDLP